MDDETFVCESCGHRRMEDDQCEHDYNIHTWCIDCCADAGMEEIREPMQWDDLD